MPADDHHQQEFSALLRRERLRAHLSIRQLADAAGIPGTTLFRLEGGQVPALKPEQLNRLARVLGIEVEDFYVALGAINEGALPGLQIYLRTKYGVSEDDAHRIEGYLQALRPDIIDSSSKEGHHDDHGDDNP